MSVHGVLTIARLELLQRVRGARWVVVLVAWVCVIAGVTGLSWLGLRKAGDEQLGSTVYDVVLFFVLGLGMLVMPALTSTSVNGDRDQGVLATLQTTLLSAADIVLGKLLAAWLIALAFLATALPFLLFGYVKGGVDLLGALRSLVVIVVVLAVVCALGLMFSTLTARPVGSAVLTYLTVAGLCFLTTIVFGMLAFLVSGEEERQVYGVDYITEGSVSDTQPRCTTRTEVRETVHTERIWPVLALNPFVIVADAAPQGDDEAEGMSGFTPLRWISQGARLAKAGPQETIDECWTGDAMPADSLTEGADDAGPVWPYGIAFLVLIGGGATAVAVQRTRTPVRRLPSGTRIA
ncbi:ABC transporter permease subunit [Janibacter melonis]|uniref:ABC transporter permease subunit n=1 Tax=Janibacter melonis TaxID=262209 RepID=A0A5P8FJP9_9MICO|nr:ABC transporter permease subunit [Janibacter melonis]QFQ29391.2 ABC transporter permease subunit [Janibacter melonis]